MLKKIVVIGPESAGKSTLCQQLADHYQTEWCPEYAREYLLKHGKKYSNDDLLVIAKGQLALEDRFAREMTARPPANPYLFIDTDMLVMKVWSEFVFNTCHPFILDQVAVRQYDLYLLCDIDIPWAPDPLREYPDLPTRERLFLMYKDILVNQSTPWIIVSGTRENRLAQVTAAINKHLT
ncbi:MAG: ATP-binding protein [Flavihumibacter sp.]